METTNDMPQIEAAPKVFSGWLKGKLLAYRAIAPTSTPVPRDIVAAPPVVQEQTTTVVPSSPEPVPECNSKRVLLIERDWLTRLLLANQMAKNGFDVETAQSGTEALTKVRAIPPDGILMEPTQDAGPTEELIKRIREICDAPIYIFSARLGDEDRRFIAPTVKVYNKLACAASYVFSEMALDLQLDPHAARQPVKPLRISVMATLEKRAKQLYNDSTLMADKAAMTSAARTEKWFGFRVQVQALANAAAVAGARSLARLAAALDYFVEIFDTDVDDISSNDWESIISASEILEMLTRNPSEAAWAMPDQTAIVVSATADLRQQARNALRTAGFHSAAFESGEEVLSQIDLDMTHLLVLHAAAPGAVKLVSASSNVLFPHKLGVILLKPAGIQRLSRAEVRPRRGATVDFLGEDFHPRELTLDALTLLHKLRLETDSKSAPVSNLTQEHERAAISSALAAAPARNRTAPVTISAPSVGIGAEEMSVGAASANGLDEQTTDTPADPGESERSDDSQSTDTGHPRLQLVSEPAPQVPYVPNGSLTAPEHKAETPDTSLNDEMAERISAAQAELSSLRTQLERELQQRRNLEAKVQELEGKLKSEQNSLAASRTEAMQAISAAHAENSSLQKRLDRESQQRRNLEANVHEMEAKLKSEQNSLATARKEAKQGIAAAQAEISSLRAQLVQESQQRGNVEAKLKELESKNQQGDLAAAQAETHKLRDALHQSTSELEQAKTRHNAELQQLRSAAKWTQAEQKKAADVEISTLHSQLLGELQERQNVEAKIQELESKLKNEQGDLAAAQAETQKFRDAFRETAKEFEQATIRYNAEIQQLKAAAERKQAEQTETAQTEISGLHSQLLNESQERQNVEAKINELESKLKNEQSALATAQAETQKLRDALHKTSSELEQGKTRYNTELQQFRAAAEQKQAEQKTSTPENFATHHAEVVALQKRNREVMASLARTTLELETERNARRELQNNAATLKEQLGNLHNQISQQLEVERANEQRIRNLEAKLHDGAELLASLQRDLDVTSARLQTAEQEKRAMKNCESELNQTLSLFEQAKNSFELTRQGFIARAETDAQTIKSIQADLAKEIAEGQQLGQLLIAAQTRLNETTRINTTEIASLQSALQAEQFERRQLHCKLSYMQAENSSIPRERVELLAVRNALHSTAKMLRETSCQLLQESLSNQQKQFADTILELTLDLQTTLDTFHSEQPEPGNQDVATSAREIRR
jgi:peptidoglycan DL-endopeptidase RipA